MSSEMIDLANEISLFDELNQETEFREPEKVEAPPAPDPIQTSTESPGTKAPEVEIKEINQDAVKVGPPPEETAGVLVAMIDGLQSPIFTALHYKKFKKKFSDADKAVIDAASVKPQDKLTEDEQHLLGRFSRLEREMKANIKQIPFEEEETTRLEKLAVPMVRKHGMDIPPSLAFALVSAQVLSNRIIDLID